MLSKRLADEFSEDSELGLVRVSHDGLGIVPFDRR